MTDALIRSRLAKRKTPRGVAWPKWMIHAETGEERIFQTADAVEDGFITRDEFNNDAESEPKPAAGKKPRKPAAPKKAAADKPPSPNAGLAEKLKLDRDEIIKLLGEAEVKFDAEQDTDDLAAVLEPYLED